VTPSTSFVGAIASKTALVDVGRCGMLDEDPVDRRIVGQVGDR
jgi:hypothetical protein